MATIWSHLRRWFGVSPSASPGATIGRTMPISITHTTGSSYRVTSSIDGLLNERSETTQPERSLEELLATVRRLSPAESPFGVEVTDFREFAGSMLSVTTDPDVANRFRELRHSRREELRSAQPASAVSIACNLSYPHEGDHDDGPIFLAKEMEDKWDIFLYDSHLFFTRSWTGRLAFKAEIHLETPRARIQRLLVSGDTLEKDFFIGVVDFLIKSHLYRVIAPHPLPPSLRGDVAQSAIYSFREYGRWGIFGTHAPVTDFRVHRKQGGGYELRVSNP